MASVRLESITVIFDGVPALRALDLDVRDGELLAILGPTGAGKSTVLRVVAGLDRPTSGDVFIGEARVNDLLPSQRNAAMVFQENALYPMLTARGNVAFPLQVAHVSRAEVDRRVKAESRVLAISHILERKPGELAAGEQQLVQAAKAMVRVPHVFLMDEPLARLDQAQRVAMRRELRLLQQGYGVTTLYVTNDQAEAMALADRIAVLAEGRLEQMGAPLDLYRNPGSEVVAGLVGSPPMRIVDARVERDRPGFQVVAGRLRLKAWPAALERYVGRPIRLGVRPEDVHPDPNGTQAAVGAVQNLGDRGFADLDFGDGVVLQMRVEGPPPRPGALLGVRVGRAHLFDPAGGGSLGVVEN